MIPQDGKKTVTQKVLAFVTSKNAKEGTLARIHQALALACFMILTLLGGYGVGTGFNDRTWLNSLKQPPFRPPDWLFGPVWTILYITIAVSGWRVYIEGKFCGQRLVAYFTQLALNFLWVPMFF